VVKKARPARVAEMVEAEIAHTERRLEEISQQMGQPEVARDASRLIALNDEYQMAEKKLSELYDEWEKLGFETTNG
jgi:predicted  nucleic acid-binding Zn-ribbon protein